MLRAEHRASGRRWRAGERRQGGGRGGVLDVPVEPVGEAEKLAQPVDRDLLELGRRGRGRQSIAFTFSAAVRNSARIGLAAGDGEVGEEARVVPVGDPGRRISSRSRRTAANGSACSGGAVGNRLICPARPGRGREGRARPPGSGRSTRRRLRRRRGTRSSLHRFLPAPRSACSRPAPRSASRAGLRQPQLEVVELVQTVRVGRDDDAHAGLGGCAGERVGEVEPVGLSVDLQEGARLPAASDALEVELVPGLLLIFRPVGWPMQSTCGCSIAATTRSVRRSREPSKPE